LSPSCGENAELSLSGPSLCFIFYRCLNKNASGALATIIVVVARPADGTQTNAAANAQKAPRIIRFVVSAATT
jgi:hypothetical protein